METAGKSIILAQRPRDSTHGSGHSHALVITVAIIFFALLSLLASITSEGFLEADGCTHYLYSRFAFTQPHYFVNIWGRPICTALYAIPAIIGGRLAVRCTSLLLAIALSLVSCAIARQQNLRRPIPALALIFTLAQPLIFLHSISELTELPFTLLLGLAFLSYQRKRWFYFALLCSILPLARPEGFGFLILAALALVGRDRFWWIAWLPVPILVWSFAGWAIYGSPGYPWYLWLARNWPYAEKSAYVAGSIAHFAMLLPAVISPLIFPAAIAGIVLQLCELPRRKIELLRDHPRRCDALIVLLPLMILAGHSLLYATGRMASSGEIRYMLIVAPFWAILAARGWDVLFRFVRWPKREVQFAMLASLAPIVANFTFPVVPMMYSDDWIRARDVTTFAQKHTVHALYPRVQAAHPGVFYFLSVCPTDPEKVAEWRGSYIDHPQRGVILIWDWIYSLHNADTDRVIDQDRIRRAGWIPISLPQIEDGNLDKPSSWKVYLSPLDASGHPTNASAAR